ncbi:TenA family transcriptional regulator [Oleiagrimonas soli]|uniref:Pyrroloquinoline quinone (PQQ) biosynthesis protein C n=1 Tax=Oleiagrimonas soli TaxID=1543381 RepID=A0A099CUP5_9GAMM|nr:iron-containing redox enzyme family protein [Oleiagrimonas soli]KGI77653.1 TenA family transcriptional regulator [Oleiagrimonas soli]MBB6182836.1 pyrroloquinoline quinone (PQQ) biosynthesis protein C [Oleiagrimonas soli]
MNTQFERNGSLTELSSYPQWTQDMVGTCEDAKRSVVEHELWDLMRDRTMESTSTRNFMVGIWPVIERFPGYMSMSLLKTQFGRSAGDNLARRWLVRNIRVEQNHAEHWLNWAEGAGIGRDEVLHGRIPRGADVLARWCEEAAGKDSLAAGIAATNYAVEGATGEWSQILFDSASYRESFEESTRTRSLRWLQLHAAYDDTHPWEALEIVCTLMGGNPSVDDVEHIAECVRRSYVSMRVLADICVEPSKATQAANEAAA